MKLLSSLSTQDKIKLAAELDGKPEPHTPTDEELASGSYYQFEPPYDTSYDAIIPAIVKWCNTRERKVKFLNCLRETLQKETGQATSDFDMLSATPRQFATAWVEAAGEWK